ncbi:30S ribosomal protein S20 [Hydrogenivirga sp. 128-5-R1-1]|uniref:30S ribosomal protein S20 n=1 Tax=Hydrogenivirga sp. 128-5-R1-1 TaxID=392423 RepID=UPI00015EF88F|nr:30S ribosomal protein S20 [Hydrogenivirga sp. 128-5-R1-1]EDP75754.1 ribosomal protein S20 [Hydrogenivirga sp. 128-5-R1-1]
MANTKQAAKRARRDAKRRERNRYHLSRMRTYIKKFRRMVQEGKLEEAKEFLPQVVSIIQHTASKGVIHKNEASRRVSRVQELLNKALAKSEG